MSLEGFQKRLMEFYRKGKEKPLMDALTGMMAEGIITLCTKCQSDRLVCALRPLCGDRKYTSLLADMGADEDEIKRTHAFCFSNHLSRLKDIRENKEPFNSVKDAKYPLKTFLDVILSDTKKGSVESSMSLDDLDPRKLFQILELPLTRAWGKFEVAYGGNIFLVLANRNAMIQIDLERRAVCLGPENEVIRDDRQFRAAVEVFSTLYSPNATLEEAIRGLDYLSFPLGISSPTQRKGSTNDEIVKLVKKIQNDGIFATTLETPKGDLRLLAELRPPRGGLYMNRLGFCYANLRNMMQLVARAANKKPPRE